MPGRRCQCHSCSLTLPTYRCAACKSPTFAQCLHDRLCPLCAFGYAVPFLAEDAEAIQHQDWKTLKTGQRSQLSAGLRRLQTLGHHNLQPQNIGRAITMDTSRSVMQVLRQAVRPSRKKVVLFEWCCEANSVLSRIFQRAGCKTYRLGLPCWDLRLESSVEKVAELIVWHVQHGDWIFVWASLPCTMWSTWQFVNQAISPKTADRLPSQRLESKLMVQRFLQLVQSVYGPSVHFGFEWPRFCQGWFQIPEILQLLEYLPFECLFDGCRYNVRDRRDRLIKKPWRMITDLFSLASFEDFKLCSGDHVHGECRGHDATRTGL